MKRIVIALAALSFATPANALTWKEFWEPFVEYSNHHHHSYDRDYHHHEDSCLPVHYDITTMFLDIITDVVMFQDTNVERLGLSTLIVTDLDIIITNPYIISLLKQKKGGKKFAVIFRPQGFS